MLVCAARSLLMRAPSVRRRLSTFVDKYNEPSDEFVHLTLPYDDGTPRTARRHLDFVHRRANCRPVRCASDGFVCRCLFVCLFVCFASWTTRKKRTRCVRRDEEHVRSGVYSLSSRTTLTWRQLAASLCSILFDQMLRERVDVVGASHFVVEQRQLDHVEVLVQIVDLNA
jgi:hypothetical protein